MQYKKKYINDKILEAGLAEYLDKGYRQGNISTIAQSAGVPVGNLYRYFDGKAGLLDALVKDVYLEIPKTIEKLARFFAEKAGLSVVEVLEHLANSLSEVFERNGRQIVILADKCATTRYEDFIDKIVAQIGELVFRLLYVEEKREDRLMSTLTARAFVHSLLDVLRLNLECAEAKSMVLRILKFYFYEIGSRK